MGYSLSPEELKALVMEDTNHATRTNTPLAFPATASFTEGVEQKWGKATVALTFLRSVNSE